ncbi:MH2 domain-containing protein [Ditylenchus destructor]|nr:MH2 domain-containing protein [Ditylenchus destructor]
MPWDCGFLCLLTDRRRYCELLWRRRLLQTADERKAKRRFLNLMRGFDSEDLDVLRRAVESRGRDIKQCCPGPPMDLVEESDEDEEDQMLGVDGPSTSGSRAPPGCSATIVSTRPRHSINRLERDRILFQRQRYPQSTTSPHSTAIAGASLISAQQRRQSSSRNRRTSSVNYNYGRRHNYVTALMDENANNAAIVATDGLNDSLSSHHNDSEDEDRHGPRHGKSRPSSSRMPDDPTPPLFDDSGLIPQIDRAMSIPYLCCKMWRWRDLQVDAALHRLDPLPWCRFGRVTINNATVSCCNPYHYALWIRPEHSSSSEEQSVAGILANGGGHLMAGGMDRTMTNDTGFGDELTGGTHTAGIGHVRHSVFKSIDQIQNPFNNNDVPPETPPPPPPPLNFELNITSPMFTPNHLPPTIHSQAMAWGRMARWEKKERIGEVVALVGQFVAVGKLAGTVFDGQDVKAHWDIENQVSFALIKQSEGNDSEDVWLYNSGDRPLFICVSRTLSSARSDTIRRLSPGYCIRVHRTPTTSVESQVDATVAAVELIHTTALAARQSITVPDPIIMNSVSFLTISVGKGWGINYDRLYVTDVPCRYEVIFT